MKTLKLTLLSLIFTFSLLHICTGQGVSISTNGAASDTSSILDVKSTTKGVLLPRMTSAQRNAIGAPADGLLVYDITTHSPFYRNNFGWQNMGIVNAPPPFIDPRIDEIQLVVDQQQVMIEGQQSMINELKFQNESIQKDLIKLQFLMAELLNFKQDQKGIR